MKTVVDFKRSLATLTRQLDTLQANCLAQGQEAVPMMAELFEAAQQTLTELTEQAEAMVTHTPDESPTDRTAQQQTELALKESERLLQVEQQQRRQAEMLSKIFLTLTSTLDLDSLLDEILTQTRKLIPCSGVNIALLAEDSLLAIRWQGYETFEVERLFVDQAQVLSDYPLDSDVIKHRQPVIVSDTRETSQWIIRPGFEWIRASVAVPITLRQRTLGLLRLDGDTPHQFSPEALDILYPLADAAAIAINNAQLYDQAQNELQERIRAEERLNKLNSNLFSLQYIGATIASTLDIETILQTVSQEVQNLLDVDGCAIGEWKRGMNTLSVLVEDSTQYSGSYTIQDYPMIQQALVERQVVQLTLSQADRGSAESKFMQRLGIKTLLMLPMEYLNRSIGLLKVMDSHTERTFSVDEVALAQYLANYAATALENARLYAELQDYIKQQHAIRKGTLVIASSLDYETVLNLITKQLGQAVDATSAYLSHYDPATRHVTVLSEYYGPRACAEERVSDVGITYTLLEDYYSEAASGLVDLPELIHVDDPHLQPDHKAHLEQFGAKTTLNFPLRIRGQIIGIAEVWESERKRDFTATEITLSQGIAQYAAVALENARLYHQAQEEIAERKLIERELRHLARKNKTLLDAIPDLMFYYDREGRVLDYKVMADDSDLAVGLTLEMMHGKRLAEMSLPPDFVEAALQYIRLALESGSLQYYEYQLAVHQGLQDFEARIVPSSADEVLTIIRNITPRKQAERALRRSEANLRAIFDNSQQAFVLMDRDYHIQAYNKAARLGLKLTTGKRLREGASIYELVTVEQAKKLKKVFFAVLAGETMTLEEKHHLGDRDRWFELTYSPVSANDGQILGICLSILDIDERKRLTDALAEREARLLAEMQSVLITTRALATEVNIKKLLQLIINQARSLTQTKGAAILVLSEDNTWLEVATTDKTWLQMKPGFRLLVRGSLPELAIATQQVQVSNLDKDDERTASIRALLQSVNVNALLCAPLIAQGENLGVLLVWHRRRRSFSDNDSRLMELFADQAALAWYNAQLYARSEELAIKQERHRLARELHDSVTQSLYSIGMAAQASLRLLPHQERDLREPLDHIHELSQIALTEIREQLYNLRPAALTEKGLVEVIRQYCDLLSRKHSLSIHFETNLAETLSLQQQEHLYYIAREALWNVVKHAEATQVEMQLHLVDDDLTLRIEDNGQGFEATTAHHHGMGLANIKERAKLLKGKADIQSKPGQGAQLLIRAPIQLAKS